MISISGNINNVYNSSLHMVSSAETMCCAYWRFSGRELGRRKQLAWSYVCKHKHEATIHLGYRSELLAFFLCAIATVPLFFSPSLAFPGTTISGEVFQVPRTMQIFFQNAIGTHVMSILETITGQDPKVAASLLRVHFHVHFVQLESIVTSKKKL